MVQHVRLTPRAIHISSAAEETYLLGMQLEANGLQLAITAVATATALAAAVDSSVTLVIADLPLPWPGAEEELSAIQRTRPDVSVVFRWGSAGDWSVEDGAAQLTRTVRQILAIDPAGGQTPEERRRALQEVVRYQQAHLQLGRLDTWDAPAAMRRALEIMADTAGVARVGIWRLDGPRDRLVCDAIFERSTRGYGKGGELKLDAAYRRAIEAATFVAADDAVHDPRTSGFARDYLIPNGITSMLDAPIRTRGTVVGIVCLEHIGALRRWNIVEQCAAAAFAGFIGRILDAQERRRIEDEWQESKRLDLIGRMAAAIAHDFSNLATVIVASAESVLEDLAPTDRHRDALLAIHEAGLSSSSLIRQLRAYATARPVDGQRPIELRHEVRAMQSLLTRLLGSAVQLVVHAGERDLWVRMDPAHFQAVVLNLAANARDAMPRGGTFVLSLDDVPPTGSTTPHGCVRLRATDNGEGIPQAVLPNIFKPLFTTKGDAGTGLGLSNVRAMVEQTGGSVSVETSSRGGTSFSVLLPRMAPLAETETARELTPALVADVVTPGLILIVDDNPAVCGVMRRIVERVGWPVEAVTSPKAAIDRAQAMGDRLGLLVTDLNMRGMSGLELIQVIRARRSTLPALIVTGQAELELAQTMVGSANTDVLIKPFEAGAFIARMRDLLDLARLASVDQPRAAALESCTVLVVDESPEARERLAVALTNARFRVVAAEDNEQACVFVEQVGGVSAAILDGRSPERLPTWINRLRDRQLDLGIVITSEVADPLSGPGVTSLPKPFAPSVLLDAIRTVLPGRTGGGADA